MMKLVLRPWLVFAAALVSLPCTALGQTPTEPEPVPPPLTTTPVEPLPEPPPPADAPSLAPVAPEPAPSMASGPLPSTAVDAAEEEPAPAPTFTGYVEAAYHINFSQPDRDTPAPLQGFYNPAGHGFVLHAAHLALAHSFNENISAVVEIDAGYDALLNSPLSWPEIGTYFDIQEAYATYKSGIFSVTAGKFATYQGIEVVEGPLNPTFSRGYLYGLAEPVTHTGVKFHFTGETVDFGIGVVNGWDVVLDNNEMKTFIFKLGLTPSDAFMVSFNGTFGAELGEMALGHRMSLDLTGAWTASESFALWFQANYGMDAIGADEGDSVSWFGIGLQPVYTSESFTFGTRVELFSDPDGARSGIMDGTFVNVTLTPGFILAQGFKVRLEVRADIATEDVLGDEAEPGKAQFAGVVGAEYVF
jgi:hypothetical protein